MKPLHPWFTLPLGDLRQIIQSVTYGSRTLGDAQLTAEIEELHAICESATDDLAARLVTKLYTDEQARRADPAHAFDDELNLILDRLERQTNAADRQRLTDIGLALDSLGSGATLRGAYNRMLNRGNPKRRHVREGILQRRWSAIAPFMEGEREQRRAGE